MIFFSFLFISLSILVLCLAFCHHVKTCRLLAKYEISSRSVYVLRSIKGLDVFSFRVFTSYDKMQIYMKNHSLPDGFRFEFEIVDCNPID